MRLRWWRRRPVEPSPEARAARVDAETGRERAIQHARRAREQAEALEQAADRFNRLLADTYTRRGLS